MTRRSGQRLLGLLALLCLISGAAVPRATAAKVVKPYVVLIVLDGARPDYLSLPNLPHIQALMRAGSLYTNAWAGILESETPAGHATIGTGSNPRSSGILGFEWGTAKDQRFSLFNPDVVRAGALTNIMQQMGVPTIAGQAKKADKSIRVASIGGHKYYANDAIGGPNADIIMYYGSWKDGSFHPMSLPGHVPPPTVYNYPGLWSKTSKLAVGVEDHMVTRLAISTFQRVKPRITFINMPEFDWPLGHVWGGDRAPASVRTLMQGFDSDLGSLMDAYRKAHVLRRTIWIITADHGMAPIYRTVSNTDITGAVKQAGTRVVADVFHTGAYLWVADKTKAALAAQNITALRNPGIQSVYYKQAVGQSYRYVRASDAGLFRTPGADAATQYLLGTFAGPTGPDLAVFFTEGTASLPGGEAQWKGDHGGSGWQSQHLPLLISGPGVRSGYVSAYPARLVDIAPTVLTLLGAPMGAMQGIPLTDAMTSPPSWASGWQTKVGKQVWPVIQALQAESRLESSAASAQH